MAWSQRQHRKNREAEESHVRKTVWGSVEDVGEGSEDDVNDFILGDVTHPTPVVMPQSSSQWPLAAGMVLATVIPTAGAGALAAYLLMDQKPAVETPAFDDSTVSIGLGKIEDYLAETPRGSGKE